MTEFIELIEDKFREDVVRDVILLVVSIFTFVVKCKLIDKTGEDWWEMFIPIYGDYLLFSALWEGKMYWIYLLVCVFTAGLISLIPYYDLLFGSVLQLIIAALTVITAIGAFVIDWMFCDNAAQSFGHSKWTAVGLFLLPFIFFPILAFGRSRYVG